MLVKIFDQTSAQDAPRITSATPVSEIILRLIEFGCPDVSKDLDLSHCASQPVASGGYSNVYKGVLYDNTLVAIKHPRTQTQSYSFVDNDRDKTLKQAARELFAWSRFTHKNIAKLLGVAIFHGQICMVSPWIEPGNFYDYLNYMKNDGKRIDHFGLCIQIAEGLAYLHGERVIYGDLKAQNLLVNLEGILKFTDFGLSILSDSVPRFSSSKDHCGGSNRWMAPELLRELSPRSLEADMYAFGMTVVEILTENTPFPERGEARLIHAILNESLIPLRPNRLNITSRRDSEWWSTLQQCWSRDRTRRPSIGYMLKMMRITEDEWCLIPEVQHGKLQVQGSNANNASTGGMSIFGHSSSASFRPNSSPSSRAFGITVGVNNKANNCIQAEADADKIDVFLRQYFKAEDNGIISLRGRGSTASAVFNAFQQIKLNHNIRKGDHFVFYFAGMIQFQEARSQRVLHTWDAPKCDDLDSPCLTDASVSILLEELIALKECSAILMLDCCSSGSRGENIISSGVLASEDSHQWFKDSSPYVTFSACDVGELAYEHPATGGLFTAALLKAVQHVDLALITYEGLIAEATKILHVQHRREELGGFPRQTPTCYGAFKKQLILRSTGPYSSTPAIPVTYHDTRSGTWILQAGSANGVISGSVWELFASTSRGSSASLGQLLVKEPGVSAAQLEPTDRYLLDLNIQIVLDCARSVQMHARQVETAIGDPLLVHFEPSPWQFNTALTYYTTCAAYSNWALMRVTPSEKDIADVAIKYVAHISDSDLEHLAIPGSWDISELQFEAQIYLQDPFVAKHNARRPVLCKSIPASAVDGALAAMVWWNWHLKRTNVFTPLREMVILRLSKIGEVWGTNLLRCNGETIQPSEHGGVRLHSQLKDRYGIQVINNSNVSLYVWAFYFSALDFSITKLMGARNLGPNIPQKGSVTIGDFGNGEPRIGFVFEKGRSVEIGFIKVFWSTTFINLDDIEQASADYGGINFASRKTFLERHPCDTREWGTLLLTVVHQNH